MSRFNKLGFVVLALAALVAAGLASRRSVDLATPAERAASPSRKWQGHRFESRFLVAPSRRASFPHPIG